jgi:uncharacterized protein YcfL
VKKFFWFVIVFFLTTCKSQTYIVKKDGETVVFSESGKVNKGTNKKSMNYIARLMRKSKKEQKKREEKFKYTYPLYK